MASSANIAAFNLGNFLGVWVSGLAIAGGLGWTSPLWVGAGFAALGLVVIVVAGAAGRRMPLVGRTDVAANGDEPAVPALPVGAGR
jgi:DHA1 family inner membrane transport protein